MFLTTTRSYHRSLGRGRLSFSLSATLLLLAASVANAQWTAINLEPALPGLVTSQGYSVHNNQQVGITVQSGETRAALWAGTAGSFVDLAPIGIPNLFASAALAVHSGTQVGYIAVVNEEGDDFSLAAMWTGTAASYVNLHPDGFEQSRAMAVQGNFQGGNVTVNGVGNAALWTGTAASYVSLHPVGPTQSFITALDGDTQAGYASVGFSHAGLWHGTPESWLDMHPTHIPEISVSAVLAAHNGQQAGWAIYGPAFGGITHPALWSGTAASYVDLLPAGWRDGMAIGAYGGRQVGNARMSGSEYRALVWSGTSDSFENLHDVLPVGYLRSNALGIWNDGVNWYVAGIAVTPAPAFTSDAYLWVSPMTPECPADFNNSGAVTVQDIFDFLAAYFGNDPDSDFNDSGAISVQDIFDFLAAYFAGCP